MPKPFKKCDCPKPHRCRHGWTVRYRVGGRGSPQREKTFSPAKYDNALAEAKAFAAKVAADKATGSLRDTAEGERTKLADYATELLARRQLAEQSLANYRSALATWIVPALGHRPLASIRRRDVQGIVSGMVQAGRKRATVEGVVLTLQMIMSNAVRDGLVTANPCHHVELPKRDAGELIIPTADQVREITEALPERLRIIPYLMAGLGLRPAEALAAHTRCVREGGTVYRVTEQVKSGDRLGPLKHRSVGDHRDVPLAPYVLDAIRRVGDVGYLVPGQRSTFTPYASLWIQWAKVTKLPIRSLRHYFASVALAAGEPITDVSEWMGHRDIKITYSTYRHLLPSSVDRARATLEGARFDRADNVLTFPKADAV